MVIKKISYLREPDRMVIDWDDGSTRSIDFLTLRQECPCAHCRADSSQPEGQALILKKVTQVGNYALNLHWADGHAMGIYPFSFLKVL